tara:strand:- start:3861 stop:4328 length:468 start_codon:yes stop_codon:yes gene_type:complete
MFNITVNGQSYYTNAEPDTPLLWVLREELGLYGTKFGCGRGICGACSIHINGEAIRSCQIRVEDAVGKTITTIEGLGEKKLHPVQEAWLDIQVPQCGYCQSGQIMMAASLIANNPDPSDQQIIATMSDNLCRCMTYSRVVKAVKKAAEIFKRDNA